LGKAKPHPSNLEALLALLEFSSSPSTPPSPTPVSNSGGWVVAGARKKKVGEGRRKKKVEEIWWREGG